VGEGGVKEGSKRFFFEKKKQKTSAYCGRWRCCYQRPQDRKFFGSFFQKRTACLAYPIKAWMPAFAGMT